MAVNEPAQTICLCMIVKNEAPVIRRCLDSLRGFIDAWVIVDTGSTDGTQDIIREHLKGLPGELFERPWVNFAHNRTEALQLSRGRADYLFIIDADEVLSFDPNFKKPRLDKHAYHFRIESGGISYLKTQLVDNSLEWCFKNVVHEFIYSPHASTESVLEGVKTLRFPDGARARDPQTYRKDALIIERALLEEPDNARYVFYLAQSYRDANEPELAIRWYKRRAEMGGWLEEVWYSLYQIAEIRKRRGDPWPEVMQAYLDAHQAKPNRAGPLFQIGIHYQHLRQFHLAYLFLRQAMEIPYPREDRLFVEKAMYTCLLPLEYAVAAYYVGDDIAALETNNLLLLDRELPAEVLAQVEQNRRFSLDRMQPKLIEPRRDENRIVVLVPFRDPGPPLDDLIESLLEQSYGNFLAVFIDDASVRDYARKLPEDSRFRYIRQSAGRGLLAGVWEQMARLVRPADIVLPMNALGRLADSFALAAVNMFMNERDCLALYGQHRFCSGHLGVALPIARPRSFSMLHVARPSVAPVAFRGSVTGKMLPPETDDAAWLDALSYAAMQASGFHRCHFNERPLIVLGERAAAALDRPEPRSNLAGQSGVHVAAPVAVS